MEAEQRRTSEENDGDEPPLTLQSVLFRSRQFIDSIISGQFSRKPAMTSGLTNAHSNSTRRTRRSRGKNLRQSACSAGKKSVHHIERREVAERPSAPTAEP